jgi:hypothetical protein
MIEAQGQHVAVAAEAVEIVFEEQDKGVQTFQKCKVPNQKKMVHNDTPNLEGSPIPRLIPHQTVTMVLYILSVNRPFPPELFHRAMYFLDVGQQTQEIIRLERQSWHHPAYHYQYL